MKINITCHNASITISCTLRKLVESFKVALLLAMPKKNRLAFLTGLAQLILNTVSQVLSIIRRATATTVSTILTIIASTIVKTGPPVTEFSPSRTASDLEAPVVETEKEI